MTLWPRRTWLHHTLAAVGAMPVGQRLLPLLPTSRSARRDLRQAQYFNHAGDATLLDPQLFERLAQQAVETARSAGANFAEARLTRKVGHLYMLGGGSELFWSDTELLGVSVRTLVDGAWGFAADASPTEATITRLARTATAQARVNSRGRTHPVELAPRPAVTGRWNTPVSIDPFAVSVEEKLDMFAYWRDVLDSHGLSKGAIIGDLAQLAFVRQERTLATSDETCITQTTYESGGEMHTGFQHGFEEAGHYVFAGLTPAGQGWERILGARIPEQIESAVEVLTAQLAVPSKPAPVGKYTVVCDGATMATVLAETIGVGTQLDRALGYEANAAGTSFLDDPVADIGRFQVAAPLVTVTANRSAPTQLATVKWDDEGVAPSTFPLIRDGVLVDFQTTREQAVWLAPYYQAHGQPVTSRGCAWSEDALCLPLQMPPNVTLEPNLHSVQMDELIGSVPDGIFVEAGFVTDVDMQASNGVLQGRLREIKNGRLGRVLLGGGFLFNTLELWRHLQALGGPTTQASIAARSIIQDSSFFTGGHGPGKGEPAQMTSFSANGVAAILPMLPLIALDRKA